MRYEIHHYYDRYDQLTPERYLVLCSCGYESAEFLRVDDAEDDGYEHLERAHPEGDW